MVRILILDLIDEFFMLEIIFFIKALSKYKLCAIYSLKLLEVIINSYIIWVL